MTRTQFRRLLLAITALVALSLLEPVLLPGLVPQAIQHAADHYQELVRVQQSTASLLLTVAYLVVNIVASIVALIGLYLFRRWSLWLNAALIVLVPVTSFVLGHNLSSWLATALSELTLFGMGAALAIAWYTPLRHEFK